MNDNYIAGFFDGEGSAVVHTVRIPIRDKIVYRLRPAIRISQLRRDVLETIRDYLGYGSVTSWPKRQDGVHQFRLDALKPIVDFCKRIGPRSYLKGAALEAVKELAEWQLANSWTGPRTKDEFGKLLDFRDRCFGANCSTRNNIKQKYTRERIFSEGFFVEGPKGLAEWHKARLNKAHATWRQNHAQ